MPAAVNSSVRSGESRGALGSLRWSCPSKNRRKPSRISAEFTFHLTQYRSYEAPAHEDSISSAPREARTTALLLPPKVVDPSLPRRRESSLDQTHVTRDSRNCCNMLQQGLDSR